MSKRIVALLSMAIAALMLVTIFAVPADAVSSSTNITSEITTKTGSTDAFGGGDQFFVNFGTDAAFGVVWGTQNDPNSVYLVTVMSRYVGVVDVYNHQGDLIADNHVAKIYTLYAVKLDSILEFKDGNGDGVLHYFRTYDNSTGQYTDYNALRPLTEPIYKRVSLDADWNASAVTTSEVNGNKTWTFSLTANDLPYIEVGQNADVNVGDGKLNNLTLTFHLDANTIHVDSADIPQYSVNMTAGMFYNLQQTGVEQISGNITSYHVKWDKSIEGWDFDSRNLQKGALMMEYGVIVGNYIPPVESALTSVSSYNAMLKAMGEGGTMSSDASSSMDGSSYTVSETRMGLTTPRLTFGGEKTKIGTFDWVQSVNVDGTEKQSHSEVIAAYPIKAVSFGGRSFDGFTALFGITYPGGNKIVQDPEISTQVVTDVTLGGDNGGSNGGGSGGDGQNSFPIGLALIGVIAAAVVIITAVVISKKGGKTSKEQYDRKQDQQQNDWSKYYEKK